MTSTTILTHLATAGALDSAFYVAIIHRPQATAVNCKVEFLLTKP